MVHINFSKPNESSVSQAYLVILIHLIGCSTRVTCSNFANLPCFLYEYNIYVNHKSFVSGLNFIEALLLSLQIQYLP